jgi:hypothetical protein
VTAGVDRAHRERLELQLVEELAADVIEELVDIGRDRGLTPEVHGSRDITVTAIFHESREIS